MLLKSDALKLHTRASPSWSPSAAIFFVNGAVYGVWATQIPLAKDRLSLDPTVLGLVILVLGGGAVTAMAASGWLIRRFGNAALIRLSGAMFCILLPMTALAPDIWSFAATLFAFGAMGGTMDVTMNAHGAQVERMIGRPWMSSFHGMWSLGGLTGAGLGGFLLWGLPGPAQALLLAIVLGGVFALAQPHLLARDEASVSAARHASLRPEAIAIALGILAALCFEAEGTVLDWGSIYLKSELGAPTEFAAAGYAAFSATMAIGRLLGDRVRQALGAANTLRGGAAVALAGMVLGPLSGHAIPAVAGFALAGLGLSNIVPVLFSAAGRSHHPDTAIATVSTLGYAGLLLGPPLLGLVAHATSFATVFLVSAMMCLAIGLCAFVVNRPRAG